jgi:hypothetical protein
LGRQDQFPAARRIAGFQFQKRSQYFIRVHNETLSAIAMCVCNPDRSPLAIQSRHSAPAASGFSEIVSGDFAVLHAVISAWRSCRPVNRMGPSAAKKIDISDALRNKDFGSPGSSVR